MRGRLWTLMLLGCALATACGSTVPLAEQGQATSQEQLSGGASRAQSGTNGGAAAGSSIGSGPGSTSADANQGTGGPGSSATGGASGATGGTSSGGGASTSGRPLAPGAVTASSPNSPVQVGFVTFPDLAAFSSLLGGTGQSGGDGTSEIQAVVKWVNAHGGLGGHPIDPVLASVALTSTSSYSEESQAVCDTFTQDNHVVAAVFVGNDPLVLDSCLSSRHVALFVDGGELHDATDMTTYPYLISPPQADASQMAATLLTQSFDRHLLGSGDTLGLMVEDYGAPDRAASHVVLPMAAARNVKVVEYTISEPTSTPDISGSVSQVSSAELKMAALGVKNVMFLCTGCMPFFMQDAQSQHYYPRYLFTSYDGPAGFTGSNYATQLANSFGIGVNPVTDVGPFTHPSAVAFNSTYQLCKSIEVPTGEVTNDTSAVLATAYCDGTLWFWSAQKAYGGATVSSTTLISGFDRLGTSWLSGLNFADDVSASRHLGVSVYRAMSWNSTCECLYYDNSVNQPLS